MLARQEWYAENGVTLHNRQDRAVITRDFRLSREDWVPVEGIEIHRLDPCLPLLGL